MSAADPILSEEGRAALAYAEAGYAVFPARIGRDAQGQWDKVPHSGALGHAGKDCPLGGRGHCGHNHATTDPAAIRSWWTAAPDARVGVAVVPSGLVVVDVDPRNGGERPADLPDTWAVTTISGGEHLYYSGRTDVRRSPWPGVDLKRNGWVVGYGPPPPRDQLKPWTDRHLNGHAPGWDDVAPSLSRFPAEYVEAGLSEGERNDGLWAHACRLRGQVYGLTLDEAEDRMAAVAAACRPPYDEWKARDMARRAWDLYDPAPERAAIDDLVAAEAEYQAMIEAAGPAVPEVTIDDQGREWVAIRRHTPGQLAVRRARGLSVRGLMALPEPAWLFAPYLLEGTLAQLSGPAGAFKSFLALDWALRLAWHEGKDVLYVVGEGLRGMKRRVRAWTATHGVPSDELAPCFHVIERPVDFLDPDDVAEFETWVKASGPWDLVVVDTLARAIAGGDENAPEIMGKAVKSSDRIQRASGGTVLLVHHFGHEAKRSRGHSSLIGACDTILHLERTERTDSEAKRSRLSVSKQKDAEPAKRITLELRPVGETGSAVLVEAETATVPAEPPPWEVAGVSRATYYRQRNPGDGETNGET